MKTLERIKNYLRLFSIKRNEAIYTCIQNDIPLTDENIKEVIGILKQKENKELWSNPHLVINLKKDFHKSNKS